MAAAAFRPETLVIGLSLVALGVAGVLANLGKIDFLATVRTWWPSSLVLWGALEIAQAVARRSSRRSE